MSDVERTALVGRVVEVVRDRGPVAVVGHPCPWRDDLVEVLAERLDHSVTAHDSVPDDAGAVVWLELSASEAWLHRARADWVASGRQARGEPLVPGGYWVAYQGLDDDPGPDDRERAPHGSDVVFVPVSGVRPPRRLRLFYDWSDHLLWDEANAHLGGLEELLALSRRLRDRMAAFVAVVDASVDHRTSDIRYAAMDDDQRALAHAVAEELAGEFVVEA